MKIDFDYAYDQSCYRPRLPDELFQKLNRRYGLGHGNQRVLDVGTGTGTMARAMAKRGCKVVGLDSAANQVEEARRSTAQAGLTVEYVQGRAEATGLPAGSFDVVTACQVWHWLNGREAALEAARVLDVDGRAFIIYIDWLAIAGNVCDLTEEIIERHNPAWRFRGWSGFNPLWMNDLVHANFTDVESGSFDLSVLYTHDYWRARVRDSAGVGQSLSATATQRFDEDLAVKLRERFPDDPMPVPHRVYCIVGKRS